MGEKDLYENRRATLNRTAQLVACLMRKYRIPLTKIYSHQAVSQMDTRSVPEVYDRIKPKPYGKSDPGEINMRYILNQLRSWGFE